MNKTEFEKQKELSALEKTNIQLKHDLKMKELETEFNFHCREHENRMSEIRLKNANIRNTMQRRF